MHADVVDTFAALTTSGLPAHVNLANSSHHVTATRGTLILVWAGVGLHGGAALPSRLFRWRGYFCVGR